MTFYKSHTRPVLKVRMTDSYLLSVSEDCSLSVHDRRAGRRLLRLHLPPTDQLAGGGAFPLSMDLLDNMLYVGDRELSSLNIQ